MPRRARRILPRRVLLLAIACCALALASLRAADRRPNVVFVFTDDHAPHAIGAYGSRYERFDVTPNIDRLARQGMVFQQSFCTNSICGPSRAVILTGKHSHENGFYTNGDRFDGSQQTFPKLLRAAGYQTAVVGKWHLKSEPTGFDYYEVLLGQGPYYNPPMRTPEGVKRHTGYTTDVITDVALEWLRTQRDPERPFFLMYQHKAPHRSWAPGPDRLTWLDDVELPEPDTLFDDWEGRTSAAKTQTMTVANHLNARDLKFRPPGNLTETQLEAWNAAYGPKNEAFREAGLEGKALVRWKYQRYMKDYLRCVKSVDDNLGRVLRYLDASGLSENTVVIYSSDQGFYLGDHGWFDKRWMYEESLRMPFIVRWPGVVRPGRVDTTHLIQNLDYAETFLDIAGVDIPSAMQGRSLLPILRGEDPGDWRGSIYYHYYEFPGAHSVRKHYGVRTRTHKLIHYYEIDEWELFDLEEDPDELESVHEDPAYAGVREELEAELRRLQELYGDTDPDASLAELAQRRLRRRAARVETRLLLRRDGTGGERPEAPDPSARPLTVGARITPAGGGEAVVLAQGGGSYGYSLWLDDRRPRFSVRTSGVLREARADGALAAGREVHLAGVLTAEGRLRILVDGESVAEAEGFLIERKPSEGLDLGADQGSTVGEYESPAAFEGGVADLRIWQGTPGEDVLERWIEGGE